MKRLRISRVLLGTVFFSGLALQVFSQSDDLDKRLVRKPAISKEEHQKRVQRDAVKRLNLLENHSKEIADPAARVRVQARIADALWHRDEGQARRLFTKAFDDAITIQDPGSSEPYNNLSCGKVRSEILIYISQRDPRFAAQLVRRGQADAGCSFGPRERATSEDGRSVMLVQIASSILAKDPIEAARLGRESLSGGIVSQLPELCRNLQEVNSSLGNELMDAAIEHIRLREINGLELVSLGREIFGEPSMKGGKAILNLEKKVDALLARRLLNASLSALTRVVEKLEANQLNSAAEFSAFTPFAPTEEIAASFYTALTELLPAFDRYDAEEAAAARSLLERLAARMDVVARNHMYVFYDNGDTPEGLMAEAEATKDERTKTELYELAAILADGKESFDRVMEIVGRIPDADKRTDMHDSVLRNQVFRLLDEKKSAEARQLMGRLIKPEMQVDVLTTMARRSAGSGDAADALGLLDEATDLLLGIRDGQRLRHAKMLMGIARMVAKLDAERGFKAFKAAINLINAKAFIPNDAEVQSRYARGIYPTNSLSLFGGDLREFEVLSRADYFQALKLAQAFDDKALGLVAELAVIRVKLSK
jgi:hypothetical protein